MIYSILKKLKEDTDYEITEETIKFNLNKVFKLEVVAYSRREFNERLKRIIEVMDGHGLSSSIQFDILSLI